MTGLDTTLGSPGFDLSWPGTLLYSPQLALQGHMLTQFALSLRVAQNRQAFLDNECAYMQAWGISSSDQDAVLRRDWTALLQSGGHLQAILKIAATVGQGLWHVGAHHVGTTVETLQAACPRQLSGVPGQETL